MKASVIVFPGSNCDRDVKVALEKFQIATTMVWHQETTLPPTDLVVLPGGFSYGDYLRCGSMASKSKVMHEVVKHAEKGGYLFGICNGFQILTETNLLPGALLRNNKLKFICKNVFVKTINNKIAFTKKYLSKKFYRFPLLIMKVIILPAKTKSNHFKIINKLYFNIVIKTE
jgi:phosphoribosylformylglycinamidine synthase I